MGVVERYLAHENVSPSILGDTLVLPTTRRVVPNRLMKTSLSECLCEYKPENVKESGLPSQGLINLYEKYGRGGYGILLTGNWMVDSAHLESPLNAVISRESDTPKRRELFAQLAKVSKADGALAIVQLSHAGRQTPYEVNPHPFSASDVQLKNDGLGKFGKPIPLSLEQIQTEVIDRFVWSAKLLKELGFDGVQLHGAHGYLLAQFTSPTTNHRTDRYGSQSVENRVRLILDIYRAIRREIPAETGFVIGVKLNSVEFQTGGTNADDAALFAGAIDKAGFDFIELSGGTYEQLAFQHLRESTKKREAFFLEFSQKIKPHVKNALLALTGGFRTLPAMVRAVEGGATDIIGLGRPVIAEPDIAAKLLDGRVASSPIIHLEYDFGVGLPIWRSQMRQIAATSLREAHGDPCYGLSDVD